MGEFGCYDTGDAPAYIKISHHGHAPWRAGGNKVVENGIGHRFVESAFLAKGPEIELE